MAVKHVNKVDNMHEVTEKTKTIEELMTFFSRSLIGRVIKKESTTT